ncbi:MAG: metal-dependent transcriptional regulator [Clostridia bacterium]|nr:metal-dependent transcriptional regulator [Clostridia bacterium]
MKYRESEETYLETILLLKKKKPTLRSIDIANELNYSRASVSRAMGLLKERGYIEIKGSGEISLTESGTKRASEVYELHELITKAIMSIGVEKTIAEENACRIEHVITDELIDKLKHWKNNC